MTAIPQKRLITAREAETYIPPFERFAGNYAIKETLQELIKRPLEENPNVCLVGSSGTGKTSMIIAYLRLQFRNPLFFHEDFAGEQVNSVPLVGGKSLESLEASRTWQCGGRYRFQQIDGATDDAPRMRSNLESLRGSLFDICQGRADSHKICFIDELGELYFRGLDEMLRPVLEEKYITTFATAQNFHSKRKTDTSQEEDQRLVALQRRFTYRLQTEPPNASDHFKFLLFLIDQWSLKLDEQNTLYRLVERADGVVAFSKRILVRAIDAPERRLTRKLVEESDVNPLC